MEYVIRVHGDIVCTQCTHYAQSMCARGIATLDDQYHGDTRNYEFDKSNHEQ